MNSFIWNALMGPSLSRNTIHKCEGLILVFELDQRSLKVVRYTLQFYLERLTFNHIRKLQNTTIILHSSSKKSLWNKICADRIPRNSEWSKSKQENALHEKTRPFVDKDMHTFALRRFSGKSSLRGLSF